MPPPSAGGLAVLQILQLLERFPIGDANQCFGFGAARTLHVMIEAMRLAFADRAVWLGDADFGRSPQWDCSIMTVLRGAAPRSSRTAGKRKWPPVTPAPSRKLRSGRLTSCRLSKFRLKKG